MQAAEPLPPAVIRQVAKELKDLQEKPEEGIKVGGFAGKAQRHLVEYWHIEISIVLQLILNEDNIADVQAEYEGPGAYLLFPYCVHASAKQSAYEARAIEYSVTELPLCLVVVSAAGTPYQDGAFRMKMILGPDFPHTPPKGNLLQTRAYCVVANNLQASFDMCVSNA